MTPTTTTSASSKSTSITTQSTVVQNVYPSTHAPVFENETKQSADDVINSYARNIDNLFWIGTFGLYVVLVLMLSYLVCLP